VTYLPWDEIQLEAMQSLTYLSSLPPSEGSITGSRQSSAHEISSTGLPASSSTGTCRIFSVNSLRFS